MNQIERVRKYEDLLDKATEVIDKVSEALELNKMTDELKKEYQDIQKTINELSTYYENGEWMEDYNADCDGAFPPCLKRGVLSEDAVYDLLGDNDIIKEQLVDLID